MLRPSESKHTQAHRRSRRSLPSTQRDERAIPQNLHRNFFVGKPARSDRRKYTRVPGSRRALARVESPDGQKAAARELASPSPSEAGHVDRMRSEWDPDKQTKGEPSAVSPHFSAAVQACGYVNQVQ
jgi:hypothetical protein